MTVWVRDERSGMYWCLEPLRRPQVSLSPIERARAALALCTQHAWRASPRTTIEGDEVIYR